MQARSLRTWELCPWCGVFNVAWRYIDCFCSLIAGMSRSHYGGNNFQKSQPRQDPLWP